MALYSERTRQTIRHEYVLPNPANWAEVDKAFSAAKRGYEDANGVPRDDSVWVTHADEEIIIYWEESK